jgi:hypothetical protein
MMRPQPRLAINGAAAPTSKKALLTLSRNARSKVPASTSGVGAAISMPPLFTTMSTPEGRDGLLDQPARRAGFLEVVGEEHRLALTTMENVQRVLVDRGTTFSNAFATTSLCCPSRVSFLRGQYAHNHGVLTNENTVEGGYERFRELGLQDSTVATWLDDVGYDTFYAGKFLNGYEDSSYVPPGWDEWYAFSGGTHRDKYRVSEGGELKTYAQDQQHETHFLRERAVVRHGCHPRGARCAHHSAGVPQLLRRPEHADTSQLQRGGRQR